MGSPVRRLLRLEPAPNNPRNSEGDFIERSDGSLLFVYTRFVDGVGHDHDPAHLVARSSFDGGLTWSAEDRRVIENHARMNIMCVNLLRAADGDLLLLYERKNSFSDCKPVVRRSGNDGTSWTDAVDLITADEGYFVLNNDRVITSKSGRLIAPVADHGARWASGGAPGRATCYLSDDSGRSWHRSDDTISLIDDRTTAGLQEPVVVQLRDGRLLMFCRTDMGCQYVSHSADDGRTWSAPRPSELRSPVSPASIKRIPSTGDLLAVWNDNYEPEHRSGGRRTPLTTAISSDDGQTWTNRHVLEGNEDGHYCYTAIHFAPGEPERVLLAYCAGDMHANGLSTTQVTSVEVPWLYA